MTRRQALATLSASAATAAAAASADKPTLCLFSKHLPHLGYKDLAKAHHDLGIPGCDLTVRPKGHVLPENVARDLPKAHAAFESEGIKLPMISTGLLSLDDPAARPTLYTAAELGVPYFKLGYYRYRDLTKLQETLDGVKRDLDGLVGLAQHAGIQGGFHNHSGTYVGSALWDHWQLLQDFDPKVIGFYFDPCHATIEGGAGGWQIGFHRLAGRINMVACKDFYWDKVGGKWTSVMCPLGQGMVDYPKFFRMLAASGFTGPISLHVEYPIGRAHRKGQARERARSHQARLRLLEVRVRQGLQLEIRAAPL